jgi:hypothetical protein
MHIGTAEIGCAYCYKAMSIHVFYRYIFKVWAEKNSYLCEIKKF